MMNNFQGDREGRPCPTRKAFDSRSAHRVGATLAVALAQLGILLITSIEVTPIHVRQLRLRCRLRLDGGRL